MINIFSRVKLDISLLTSTCIHLSASVRLVLISLSSSFSESASFQKVSFSRHLIPEALIHKLTGPTKPHAHPAAPVEVKESFSVRQTPRPNSGSNPVFFNFWEAPERFWRKEIEDAEIEAILVSISILYRIFVN